MKIDLRSLTSTGGRRMAGARSLWRANGMTDKQMGKPIIAIVNSFTQFVPGHVHLHEIGQKVKVTTDFGKDDIKEYTGTLAWISSKSEFTPKTIQTRDERANLVYAVKINVRNNGLLKIGMYGEVSF